MSSVLEECKTICRLRPGDGSAALTVKQTREWFYDAALFGEPDERVRRIDWTDVVLNFFIVMAVVVVLGYFLPSGISRVWSRTSDESETTDVQTGEFLGKEEVATAEIELVEDGYLLELVSDGVSERQVYRVEPEYDLNLPEGRWVISEAVGLKAEIFGNDDLGDKKVVNEILDKGVYIYPQDNQIGWRGKRVILAGHHYNMAVTEEKAAESFQNLKKLQVGDKVKIVDDYKVWTYEIYKVEESTQITESEPDLMMYTCVYWWDSKLRLFVYGRIVEG